MRPLIRVAPFLVLALGCGSRTLEDIPGYNVPRGGRGNGEQGGSAGDAAGGSAGAAGRGAAGSGSAEGGGAGTSSSSGGTSGSLGGTSGASGTSGAGAFGGSSTMGGAAGVGGGPGCVGGITDDRFNPNRVYLIGTLAPGSCGYDGIVVPECPNSAAVGFDCDFGGNSEPAQRSAQIRSSDGRLLYKDVFAEEIREFHCDDCPYLGANANAYPSNGPANDPVVPAPCALGLTGAFLIDPEGSLFFQCGAEWMDEGGRVVYSSGDSALAHLGYGGLALTRGTIGWYEVSGVVDLGTGETAPVVGLPDGNVYARRAVSPDRFLVFFVPEDASSLDVSQLWEIAPDGSATHRGDYPPFPTEVGPAPGAMLLPDGVLFQMANGPRIVHDAIVRREIGGVSEVVYTEANDPHVKIHISGLLTGP